MAKRTNKTGDTETEGVCDKYPVLASYWWKTGALFTCRNSQKVPIQQYVVYGVSIRLYTLSFCIRMAAMKMKPTLYGHRPLQNTYTFFFSAFYMCVSLQSRKPLLT